METPPNKDRVRDGGAKKGDIAVCDLKKAYKGLEIQFLEDEPGIPEELWGTEEAKDYRRKKHGFLPKPSIIRAKFRVVKHTPEMCFDETIVFKNGCKRYQYGVDKVFLEENNWKIFASEGYKVLNRKQPIPDHLK